LVSGRIEAVVAIDHTRSNQVSLRWLLYDGHGNLVRTLSPDYTLSAFQWRGVWSEVQGSLGVGRGYCANLGHPEDETGLVYMRARYYEPATGRFISEDPARDGMNWYLYAEGNPITCFDPTGRFTLLDLLLGEDEEFNLRVREWATAQHAKGWAEHKIMDILWSWATQFSLMGDEIALIFGEGGSITIAASGRWAILFHWTKETWAPHGRPHLQLMMKGWEQPIREFLW